MTLRVHASAADQAARHALDDALRRPATVWATRRFGWRFLNVVVGALTVGVLVRFRQMPDRLDALCAIAAGMLLFDGFHFVQSRIATPEITVAFFSLTTLTRSTALWIAAQRGARATLPAPVVARCLRRDDDRRQRSLARRSRLTLATNIGPSTARSRVATTGRWFVAFVYFETASIYLRARWLATRASPAVARRRAPYADGTRLRFVTARRDCADRRPRATRSRSAARARGRATLDDADGRRRSRAPIGATAA